MWSYPFNHHPTIYLTSYTKLFLLHRSTMHWNHPAFCLSSLHQGFYTLCNRTSKHITPSFKDFPVNCLSPIPFWIIWHMKDNRRKPYQSFLSIPLWHLYCGIIFLLNLKYHIDFEISISVTTYSSGTLLLKKVKCLFRYEGTLSNYIISLFLECAIIIEACTSYEATF